MSDDDAQPRRFRRGDKVRSVYGGPVYTVTRQDGPNLCCVWVAERSEHFHPYKLILVRACDVTG